MTNCVHKYNINNSVFVDFIIGNKKRGMSLEGYHYTNVVKKKGTAKPVLVETCCISINRDCSLQQFLRIVHM
jgi:hypothetical protein